MICLNCGNEFEAKRADAKYCGDACRKTFKRRLSDVRDNSVVRDNVRDNPGRFEDLPKDVQESIEYMSNREGVEYEAEKALRTERAWAYLRKFPDRFRQYGRVA